MAKGEVVVEGGLESCRLILSRLVEMLVARMEDHDGPSTLLVFGRALSVSKLLPLELSLKGDGDADE